MEELDIASIAASILITWTIGLMPPLVIRYAVCKRPLGKWPAASICLVFFLINILIFTALGSRSKTHAALWLVAAVSYWILRRLGVPSTSAVPAASSEQSRSSSPTEVSNFSAENVSAQGAQSSPSFVDHIGSPQQPSLEGSVRKATIDASFEEELWAAALAEFESAARRPGLWARVYSEAKGNEAVAKASYLKTRVDELIIEHQKERAAEHEAAQLAIERARLEKAEEARRAYEALPKGTCPNCAAVIPLSAQECPNCQALFVEGSGWRVQPIGVSPGAPPRTVVARFCENCRMINTEERSTCVRCSSALSVDATA